MAGLCAAVIALAASARAVAAESAALFDVRRTRAALSIGAGGLSGRSSLRAPPSLVDARLDGLPRLALGLEAWPVEQLGVRVALELGLGAELTGPARGSPPVNFNETRFEALARFRRFFGVRSDAPALLVGTGVRVERTTATHREPALLIDRLIAGPVAELALEYPLLQGDLVGRLSALAGLPFFVQEPHRDSGDPSGRLALGARLELWFRLSGRWGLWTSADFASTSLTFRGEGTRGLGVRDAETDDLRLQVLAGLRWSLVRRGSGNDL